jgi:AcrR family transcriptional regulator
MERRTGKDKRARILAAARGEFAARGYHGTSIDIIIKRAEVARGTFYLHFKSKRSVFEAALEELIALVYQALPPIVPTEAVAPQALRNIERVLESLIEDGDLARILLMEGLGPDAESRERILRLQERLMAYAEKTLGVGQSLGMVRAGDVRVMAAFLIGAVKEVLYQHITGLRSKADLAPFPHELLATVLTGLGTDAVRHEFAANTAAVFQQSNAMTTPSTT